MQTPCTESLIPAHPPRLAAHCKCHSTRVQSNSKPKKFHQKRPEISSDLSDANFHVKISTFRLSFEIPLSEADQQSWLSLMHQLITDAQRFTPAGCIFAFYAPRSSFQPPPII